MHEHIRISKHALDRWRERGALYADANNDDLRQALSNVRRMEPCEMMGRNRCALNQTLWLHEETGCVFVIKKIEHGGRLLTTILEKDAERNAITPKLSKSPVPVAPVKEAKPLSEEDEYSQLSSYVKHGPMTEDHDEKVKRWVELRDKFAKRQEENRKEVWRRKLQGVSTR